MGNVAYFIGCPSRRAAEAIARGERPIGDAPRLWSGKYVIPPLWLAGFAGKDCVVVPGETGEPGFTACIATASVFVERLTRRRAAILAALGEELGDIHDVWVRLIGERFRGAVLLHTEEIFGMMPFAAADGLLRRVLAAHETADHTHAYADPNLIDGFGTVPADPHAPVEPGLLVGWGADWPPALVRPAAGVTRPEDASFAELGARLESHMPDCVHRLWLDGLSDEALDVLWMAGRHAQVYALIRGREPRKRAPMLAWYAGLDPDPKRAHAAAREALALAPIESATLATVPLDAPALARLARRAAKDEAHRLLLALRLGEALRESDAARVWGEARALVWATAAVQAGDRGDHEAAEAALTHAFTDWHPTTTTLLLAFRTWMRCGAWSSAIPESMYDPRACCAAVDEALRRGPEALRGLLERFPEPMAVAAALYHDEPSTQAPAGPDTVAAIDEQYYEGLITPWEREVKLACHLSPRAAGIAASIEMLTCALAGVPQMVDEIVAACEGRPRDEALLAEHRSALASAVATARTSETPTTGLLASLRTACTALADAGEAAAVGLAVDQLERAWGPAASWRRKGSWRSRAARCTVEIVASAAGRSLDAAQIVEAQGHDAEDVGRACVIAGLVRDGELEQARLALVRLLAGPPAPETLPLLTAIVTALVPACSEPLRRAAAQAAAVLPDSREAVAAWLAGP